MVERRGGYRPSEAIGRGPRHLSTAGCSCEKVEAGRSQTKAEDLPGVLGVAADLVSAPAEIAPVVAALLGRTLVADDLVTARAALGHLPPGWSVVTVTGEIAHAGGAVTGGSAAHESGTLGRERELRELPDAIAALERDLAGGTRSSGKGRRSGARDPGRRGGTPRMNARRWAPRRKSGGNSARG